MTNGKIERRQNEKADHDLLIRLDEKVGDIQVSIKTLQDGTFSKIAMLEKDKADRREVEELQKIVNEHMEVRVRNLENKTSKYFITLTLYSIAVATMISLIIYHILKAS
ncbi:MAG: hypothetical protein WC549_04715 [Actinomycetota bacterium]